MDVFRVGVSIAMSSNASGVLGAIAKDLFGLQAAAKALEGQLGKVKIAAIGAITAFAGIEAVKGVWKLVEAGRELNKELERTKQLGGDFARNVNSGAALRAAVGTQLAVPTSSASGNVRLQRELGTQLSHPEAAADVLPFAAKAALVVSHYTGEDQEKILKNLVRVADDRGQIFTRGADGKEHVDQSKLQGELQAAVSALILGGGFLNSGDLLQRTRMAGPAAKGQTPEAFYGAGAEEAVMLGASRSGTAQMSLFQQFIGGTMTKKVAEHLTSAGILGPNDWHSGKSGGVVVNPGVAGRFAGMASDPEKFFSESGDGGRKIADFAAAQGISPMMAVFQLFGRQTVQRLVSDYMTNGPQFERARQIFGGIPNVGEQYKELMANDLDTNIKAFDESLKSMFEVLGNAAIPEAIKGLQGVTGVIQDVMKWAAGHQDAVRIITDLAAAIGIGLAVAGGVTMVGAIIALAGPVATVTAAIAALTAAFALLGPSIPHIMSNGGGTQGDVQEQLRQNQLRTKPPRPNEPLPWDFTPISYIPQRGGGQGGAIPVIVTNGRDIADGVFRYGADRMARDPGRTGFDGRVSPALSAA